MGLKRQQIEITKGYKADNFHDFIKEMMKDSAINNFDSKTFKGISF